MLKVLPLKDKLSVTLHAGRGKGLLSVKASSTSQPGSAVEALWCIHELYNPMSCKAGHALHYYTFQ